MGFFNYYLKSHDFVLIKISGDVNDQNLMQHVVELNRETKGFSNFRELVDCTEIKNMEALTSQGTVQCAQAKENKPGSLLALLVNDSHLLYGMLRTYQTFVEVNSYSVKIFEDIGTALTWLASDEHEIEVLRDFVNSA